MVWKGVYKMASVVMFEDAVKGRVVTDAFKVDGGMVRMHMNPNPNPEIRDAAYQYVVDKLMIGYRRGLMKQREQEGQ